MEVQKTMEKNTPKPKGRLFVLKKRKHLMERRAKPN